MRPGEHRSAGELRTVVRAHYEWLATLRTDRVEDPRQMIAADRVLGHDRYRFVRRIVRDYQELQRAPRCDSIEHEVHRPNLVRSTRAHQRLAICYGDLFPPSPADVQLLEPIQSLDALVVHELAGLAQLQVDHADAVAPIPLR